MIHKYSSRVLYSYSSSTFTYHCKYEMLDVLYMYDCSYYYDDS